MKQSKGFSLVEISLALLIFSLLLGGLLQPLRIQLENIKINETQQQLRNITDALYGFAASNGRLPCPAFSGSAGNEARIMATGQCSHPYNGYVPGRLLGLGPLNTNGYLLDAWGQPIHYAVADLRIANGSYPLTATPSASASQGIKYMTDSTFTGIAALASLTPNSTTKAPSSSFLSICNSSNGLINQKSAYTTSGKIRICGGGTANNVLSSDAVAVIYSTGTNQGAGHGFDELVNPNANNTDNDATFVWHARTGSAAAGGEFDDQMEWIPRSLLITKMINAGQLP